MKDYLFVFRNDAPGAPNASPEEMQASTLRWMDWIGSIAAQGSLTDRGNRLAPGGKVVKAEGVITDGPYTEIKELILGYILVKADSLEDAAKIADGCPIFAYGGNVEVREISAM